MRVTGFPVIFDSASVDLGGFTETIRPQAVDRALRDRSDIAALHNHDSSRPLGRTSAKTLTLRKDTRGLAIELDADDSISYVADLDRIIKRGDAVGGSFGFRVVDDIWTLRDGQPHREVIDMVITEISIGVTFPAYKGTRLQVGAQVAPRHTRSISFLLREHKQRLTKNQLQRFTSDQLRLAK